MSPNSVRLQIRKSACMTVSKRGGRRSTLLKGPLFSATEQRGYPKNQTRIPPTACHISAVHPGALQQHREEQHPVFPLKWKELNTIITVFSPKVKASELALATMSMFCFYHDSFILPRPWAQLRRGHGLKMSNEETSGALLGSKREIHAKCGFIIPIF